MIIDSAVTDSLKILIVDDEPLARLRLVQLLKDSKGSFEIIEACDGAEAIEKYLIFKPDLVFLDVEMPEMDGFDVLANIEQRCPIIFATAYQDYALRAFEESAVDYLLKPFTAERFAIALQKGLHAVNVGGRLAELERFLIRENRYLESLALKIRNRIDIVDVKNILYIISKEHYSFVYAEENEYITELSLSHLEERLSPKMFLRVHRNSIVNLIKVKRFHDIQGGILELEDGYKVAVSRRSKQQLLERISLFGKV